MTFTPADKVERLREILDREDLTAQQKCVGAKLIVEADRDGAASVRTGELQRAAGARDRETVFRATVALKAVGITKESRHGQAGRFSVLPKVVIDAVVDAFDALKTGRAEPDGFHSATGRGSADQLSTETGRAEPDQINQIELVGSRPTGRVEPVGSGPTGQVEPDRSGPTSLALVPVRAYKENPSGLNICSVEEKERGVGALDPLAAFNDWNDLAQRCGLPLARSLTPQRRKLIIARLREHGGADAWRVALANIERSAFLRGANERGWRADLDFLLQASRFAKVVDGAYGNGAHGNYLGAGPGTPPKEGSTARTLRLAREAAERMVPMEERR